MGLPPVAARENLVAGASRIAGANSRGPSVPMPFPVDPPPAGPCTIVGVVKRHQRMAFLLAVSRTDCRFNHQCGAPPPIACWMFRCEGVGWRRNNLGNEGRCGAVTGPSKTLPPVADSCAL